MLITMFSGALTGFVLLVLGFSINEIEYWILVAACLMNFCVGRYIGERNARK